MQNSLLKRKCQSCIFSPYFALTIKLKILSSLLSAEFFAWRERQLNSLKTILEEWIHFQGQHFCCQNCSASLFRRDLVATPSEKGSLTGSHRSCLPDRKWQQIWQVYPVTFRIIVATACLRRCDIGVLFFHPLIWTSTFATTVVKVHFLTAITPTVFFFCLAYIFFL